MPLLDPAPWKASLEILQLASIYFPFQEFIVSNNLQVHKMLWAKALIVEHIHKKKKETKTAFQA